MRLMIDGYNLALPQGTGVATYGHQLAAAAQGLGIGVEGLYGLRAPFNPRLREVLFYEALGNGHATRRPRLGSPAWLRELAWLSRPRRARAIPVAGQVLTGQFAHRLPRFDALHSAPDLFDLAARNFKRTGLFTRVAIPGGAPDVMHWTYPFPVRMPGVPNLYTLHDLVPLKLPYASADNKRLYARLIRKVIAGADRIVTVSEASRADILQLFPQAEPRLVNTWQAVRLPEGAAEEPEEEVSRAVRSIFGLDWRGYFLFFGAIEPKKNLARLIEAYLSLGTDTPLVIVGQRSFGSRQELRLLRRDELNPLVAQFRNVRRIDYLPRSLLLRLVRGAKAVTFPSIYEGFGLPVLEAMALGTPVLTSNTSSLPEVAGDAALLVDPYSPASIAAGLRALDGDAELRARLAAAGRVRADFFSPERYRERLARLYGDLFEERARAGALRPAHA
ncbi:glycosyltransferase family 1 protein [Sphingomonas sp. HITSZ_GF]|uniref:glycosyltransferase family 4 protein n=1 Tax=Sphingomonas sp. HITSZ_GF TaxID=3037247 RepID=UPI00240E0DDC|nr:glycosyltransferase family 1 protein [Sphingomonas sp. HITSZ_GF]MDG2533786.1 glycosyltransferase family 1 protein [Sphingomonas sp. HITSZ_GF]